MEKDVVLVQRKGMTAVVAQHSLGCAASTQADKFRQVLVEDDRLAPDFVKFPASVLHASTIPVTPNVQSSLSWWGSSCLKRESREICLQHIDKGNRSPSVLAHVHLHFASRL